MMDDQGTNSQPINPFAVATKASTRYNLWSCCKYHNNLVMWFLSFLLQASYNKGKLEFNGDSMGFYSMHDQILRLVMVSTFLRVAVIIIERGHISTNLTPKPNWK